MGSLLTLGPGNNNAFGQSPSGRGIGNTPLSDAPGNSLSGSGEEVEIEGELQVLHEDWARGGRYLYYVKTKGNRYGLQLEGTLPSYLSTGTKVRVRGVYKETYLALGKGKNKVRPVEPPPEPSTLNEQSTLVILVNFSDNWEEPYDISHARNVVFNETDSFYRENSYGQAWLDGTIAGWYTVPIDSASCDFTAIAEEAILAAEADGIDTAAYAHHMYAFPQSACGWWGLSSIGGNPSQSWVNGDLELGVAAHELGHGFGLFHSHSLDCNPDVVGSGCSVNEYGDIVDMMGSSHYAHFNAFQKERLGWLNSNAGSEIVSVTGDGAYDLAPYEIPGAGPKALKIPGAIDPASGNRIWYYMEWRQPIGFDTPIGSNGGNVPEGILVHRATEGLGNSVSLLDMTPDTPVYLHYFDPVLAEGESFEDPESSVVITTITATSPVATVSIGANEGAGEPASPIPDLALYVDNSAAYVAGQTVVISGSVIGQTGQPIDGASVGLDIIKPDDRVVHLSGATDAEGTVTFSYRLKRKDPPGNYSAYGVAVVGSMSGSDEISFTVY